jgi:beta-phosphoglucomutase-like phosphatase (HAD superfamily)
VPTALVTNAGRANVDAIVRAAPTGSLEVVVTSDDVTDAKPHPEAYLTAATLLGIDAEASIGVEDSEPGSRAVVAAGMALWFVRSHSEGPGFEAARSVATLAEVTADDVLAALDAR